MKLLLEGARCGETKCLDWETYETTSDVSWYGIQLHEDWLIPIGDGDNSQDFEFLRFGHYREVYLNGILAKMESYLPDDDIMKVMQSLDQSLWPEDILEIFEDENLMDNIKKWPSVYKQLYSELNLVNDLTNLAICLSEGNDGNTFW